MFDYELLSGISIVGISARGRVLLRDGWKCGGYPPIKLDQEIPWSLSDSSRRSWNFHIHSWDMLDLLLAGYSVGRDVELLIPCLKIALDWSDRYGARGGAALGTPFAWYDMAVGLRAYRLAYLIESARKEKLLVEKEDKFLWAVMLEHQEYLKKDSNIAFHNNHGYYQVAGQLAMGRRFRDFTPVMQQAYAQGEERLSLMLNQQFAADGVHREHSPDYHRMTYETLSGLINSGLVSNSALYNLACKVEEALAWFVLPNQQLVNFGDSDCRNMSRGVKEVLHKWRTPAMRWQASAGAVGENSVSGLKRFETGGYFIYRQQIENFTDKVAYLAQTAAFHSRTHKHADDLSFVWYDRGMEILVDAGRYGYLGKTEQGSKLWLDGHWYSDPKRIYCESTRAHNCLEFNDENYPRKNFKPYGVALGRSLETSSGLVILESECRHFKGNRHVRLLILNPGEWLIVFDWFHDNLNKQHGVKQWFHLAPEWRLAPVELGYCAISNSTSEHLCIAQFGDAEPSRLYIGEEQPYMQGWCSPSEREFIENYCFSYSIPSATTGCIATIFGFSGKILINKYDSFMDSGGRRMKFLWRTERREYQLEIKRPKDGDISVIYEAVDL